MVAPLPIEDSILTLWVRRYEIVHTDGRPLRVSAVHEEPLPNQPAAGQRRLCCNLQRLEQRRLGERFFGSFGKWLFGLLGQGLFGGCGFAEPAASVEQWALIERPDLAGQLVGALSFPFALLELGGNGLHFAVEVVNEAESQGLRGHGQLGGAESALAV